MRVEQYNGFAMSRTFSGTKKIGNISLPDFKDFHFNTRSKLAMSEEKFEEAIVEQAKKDQAVGKFQTQSSAYKDLMKSYVSIASPDREGIITNALNNLFKNSMAEAKNINYLDLLLFGKVTYEKEIGLSYAEFKDSSGELMASYSNGGWTFYGTKAENARESDFLNIYNRAWDEAAKCAKGAGNTNSGTGSVTEGRINTLV